MCWEIVDDIERSALMVDLSMEGARIERPFVGGRLERAVPLQLEVPGLDEVMWANAEVVFDQVVPARATRSHAPARSPRPAGLAHEPQAGPFGLLRRTGYRIVTAAARDLRLLRDYVFESYRSQIDAYNARYASTMRSAL